VFFGSFPICSRFVLSLVDCNPKLWDGAAFSIAGHSFNDFDTQAGKRSVDSEGWLEIDHEVWRRSFVSGILLD
jgi:hypothetical protein